MSKRFLNLQCTIVPCIWRRLVACLLTGVPIDEKVGQLVGSVFGQFIFRHLLQHVLREQKNSGCPVWGPCIATETTSIALLSAIYEERAVSRHARGAAVSKKFLSS